MVETKYKIPKDASKYEGEFIVFFSEEEDPRVLFHSLISEEAYKKAKEIEQKEGKTPVVIRVSGTRNNLEQSLVFK